MVRLTEEQAVLFRRANVAVATPIRADGSLRASVVWVDEEGRPVAIPLPCAQKSRHLRRDPRVYVLVWDRDDPYRYIEVKGTAIVISERAVLQRLTPNGRGEQGARDVGAVQETGRGQASPRLFREPA
jgi:PPOX class probable F420-dependent enzyme